jgi:hypothetical protein
MFTKRSLQMYIQCTVPALCLPVINWNSAADEGVFFFCPHQISRINPSSLAPKLVRIVKFNSRLDES